MTTPHPLPQLAARAKDSLLGTPDNQPPNQTIVKDLVNWLRKLHKSDETAQQVFDYLFGAKEHYKTNSVQFLQKAGKTDYYLLIRLLKTLAANGFGTFIVGRKGKDSRMTWRFHPKSLGAAANFRAEDLPQPSSDLKPYDGGAVDKRTAKHSFRLREDYNLDLVLPSDFNKKDAARLSRWLEALPFD